MSQFLSHSAGEDAYFLRPDSAGVADGVGGWAGVKGANPAYYAACLLHHASNEMAKYDLGLTDDLDPSPTIETHRDHLVGLPPIALQWSRVDPRQILFRAAGRIPRKVVGSSTAVIAAIRGEELRLANLGDSGARLFRYTQPILDPSVASKQPKPTQNKPVFAPSRAARHQRPHQVFLPFPPFLAKVHGGKGYQCLLRTQDQTHSFNFPFQLGTGSSNTAQDADNYTFPVQESDMVVLGTDGLFDNLFDNDLAHELEKWQMEGRPEGVQGVAQRIAQRAQEVSRDKRAVTPFNTAAYEEGILFQGGKMDDITVVVLHIKEGDSPDRR